MNQAKGRDKVMCAREGVAFSVLSPGAFYSLLPRWLLYRAGIEDTGSPHSGETGASVL